MDKIKLRAHHGMCIANFRGEGYDNAFTANMTRLVKTLRENPQTIVTVVSKEDILCGACPHKVGQCESAEKVTALDNEVLELCSLKSGAEIAWEQFSKRVKTAILSTPEFERLCKGCEWYYICQKVINE